MAPGARCVQHHASFSDATPAGKPSSKLRWFESWKSIPKLIGKEELKRWIHVVANTISFDAVSGTVAEMLKSGAIQRVFSEQLKVGTPDLVFDACRRFPDRVAVGIDARAGRVAVKGWLETSATTAIDLARRLEGAGVACLIYTDIERDGTQQGVNVAATRALAEATSIPVIASGGVGSLADIEALVPCAAAGVIGVIVGRALYTGAVRLEDALRIAGS